MLHCSFHSRTTFSHRRSSGYKSEKSDGVKLLGPHTTVLPPLADTEHAADTTNNEPTFNEMHQATRSMTFFRFSADLSSKACSASPIHWLSCVDSLASTYLPLSSFLTLGSSHTSLPRLMCFVVVWTLLRFRRLCSSSTKKGAA